MQIRLWHKPETIKLLIRQTWIICFTWKFPNIFHFLNTFWPLCVSVQTITSWYCLALKTWLLVICMKIMGGRTTHWPSYIHAWIANGRRTLKNINFNPPSSTWNSVFVQMQKTKRSHESTTAIQWALVLIVSLKQLFSSHSIPTSHSQLLAACTHMYIHPHSFFICEGTFSLSVSKMFLFLFLTGIHHVSNVKDKWMWFWKGLSADPVWGFSVIQSGMVRHHGNNGAK